MNVLPPFIYNGSVVAMLGQDCVAIGSDYRFDLMEEADSEHLQKIVQLGPLLYLGMVGLQQDIQMVRSHLMLRQNLDDLKLNMDTRPEKLMELLCNLLYEKQSSASPYMVEPVLVSMDGQQPLICSVDPLGHPQCSENFVVAGPGQVDMLGECQMMWRPNLDPTELYNTIGPILKQSLSSNRNLGWAARVYIIEKTQVTERNLHSKTINHI